MINPCFERVEVEVLPFIPPPQGRGIKRMLNNAWPVMLLIVVMAAVLISTFTLFIIHYNGTQLKQSAASLMKSNHNISSPNITMENEEMREEAQLAANTDANCDKPKNTTKLRRVRQVPYDIYPTLYPTKTLPLYIPSFNPTLPLPYKRQLPHEIYPSLFATKTPPVYLSSLSGLFPFLASANKPHKSYPKRFQDYMAPLVIEEVKKDADYDPDLLFRPIEFNHPRNFNQSSLGIDTRRFLY